MTANVYVRDEWGGNSWERGSYTFITFCFKMSWGRAVLKWLFLDAFPHLFS